MAGDSVGIDEIQRLRRLVPARPDFHLSNWGMWRRSYRGTMGFNGRSAGFVGGGYSRDCADMQMEADGFAAEVSDAIIGDLDLPGRLAISHVYECAVWRFNRLQLEDVLLAAAGEFWRIAERRGLV